MVIETHKLFTILEYNNIMNHSRRNTLILLSTGLMSGLAGCSSFNQEYAPIVLNNNHNKPHTMSISITSIPDDGPGFTEYFSDAWLVDSGGEHTFEEGLAIPDYGPELMILVMLENGIEKRTELLFSFTKLKILITENGEIEVNPIK